MAIVMHTDGVAAAYDRWAPVYDLVFGPVFRTGRSLAVEAANRVGGRVLEVGVGTGLSLPGYGPHCRVLGCDISERSLARARRRVARLDLRTVEALRPLDAQALDLPDASFDAVVAQYVVTAVPEPERALDEFARVLRPNGEIIITTRLGAGTGLRGTIERTLMPLTSRLGFRTEFPFERYHAWQIRNGRTTLVQRRPLPPLGHFALLRFRKQS